MVTRNLETVKENIRTLENSIAEKRARLRTLPEGRLSCYKDGNQYKWVRLYNEPIQGCSSTCESVGGSECESAGQSVGVTSRGGTWKREYISREKEDKACALAYKTYLEKSIADEERELAALRAYIRKAPTRDTATEYMKKNPELNRMLMPYTKKWDVNAERWRSTPSIAKNPYPVEKPLYTKAGEVVRSKGEMIICDRLYDLGIPYKVENAVDVREAYKIIDEMRLPYSGPRYQYLFPDITVLDSVRGEVLWEHMGLWDKPKYVQHNCDKTLLYSLIGYRPFKNLITTYEDNEQYMDTMWLDKIIDYFFIH